jgi:hypothetical protein
MECIFTPKIKHGSFVIMMSGLNFNRFYQCLIKLYKDKAKPNNVISKLDIDKSHSTIDKSKLTLDKSRSTIDKSKLTLDKSRSTIDKSKLTLDKSQSTLDKSKLTLINSQSTLVNSWLEIIQNILLKAMNNHLIIYFKRSFRDINSCFRSCIPLIPQT